MATRAELSAQAAAQTTVVATAWSQFQVGWAELGLTTAAVQSAAGVVAVQDLLADIIDAWGEVAGTIAADFYDMLREQADPGGQFDAPILDPLNRDQVDGIVRWALDPRRQAESVAIAPDDPKFDPLDDGQQFELVLPEELDLDQMLTVFEGPTQRLIRKAERQVLAEAVRNDPAPRGVRVARVPTGDETCAFCLVMASRGYVYRSTESAGRIPASDLLGDDATGWLNRFHDWCDCDLDISWDRTPTPPDGYDPGDLYGRYEQARGAATGNSLRAVLKQLRLQEGIR